VAADAEMASIQRQEPWDPSNRLRCLVQVARLVLVTDAFGALLAYRVQTALGRAGRPVLSGIAHRVAMMWGQVSIGDPVLIEAGVLLPHGQVVIDGFTEIGSGARIRPFVTIGLLERDIKGPTIGANVKIGTGAKVIGPVTVGDEATIGANAVVVDDVAAGSVVVGAPAEPTR
jgi:serine O-acetyltransferase